MRSEKSLLYKKNKLEKEVNLLIDAFENNGYQSYPENINYIGYGILRKEISGAKNKVKHLVEKIKDLENIKNDIETRHGLKNKSALEINELIKERINEGHYEILKDNIESNIKENKYQDHKESQQNKLPIKINKDTYRDIDLLKELISIEKTLIRNKNMIEDVEYLYPDNYMNDKDSLNDMSLVLKKRYKSLFKEYKNRYLKENNINIKSIKKEIKTSTMVFTLGLILLYFQENIIYLLFSSKDNQNFPIIVIFLLIKEAFKIFNKSILYFNNDKRLNSIDKKFLPYYYSKRDLKFNSDEVRYLKKIIE